MDDDTPLHQAAEAGSIRCVTLLVSDCRTQIEARNVHGQTPIMMAARANRVEVSHSILESFFSHFQSTMPELAEHFVSRS